MEKTPEDSRVDGPQFSECLETPVGAGIISALRGAIRNADCEAGWRMFFANFVKKYADLLKAG